MKKIYITCKKLNHGGTQKMICNLSNLFITMNYDVEILCTHFFEEVAYYLDDKVEITYLSDQLPEKHISLKKRLKNLNFKDFRKDFYSKYYLQKKVANKFIKFISNIENSVIISTRNDHTKLVNKYSKENNKLIAQFHCDHTTIKGYLKDIRYQYNRINYLLLLTEELKNEVESNLLGYNQNTECLTVPNFIINKRDIKNTKRKKQIITVGRLTSGKGFDRLLLIWEKFIVNNQDYMLKIVGDGEEKEKLIQLAEALNISHSIIFTGSLSNDETVEEIRKSKLFVMTSLREALPMVLLEAITQGTPIIAYDVRVGPRSIIKDGYNGYLVEEGNIEKFVEKLEFLISENDIYSNMSENAIVSSQQYSEENLKNTWFYIIN